MPKYKQYFQKMLDENKEIFSQFEEIHALFDLEPQKHQQDFNSIGDKIQDLVREYENRLCSHSEKGKYGKYSTKLAEKFQELVKTRFPRIDYVGVTVSKSFVLKKISFS